MRMKGVEVIKDAAEMAAPKPERPKPPTQAAR